VPAAQGESAHSGIGVDAGRDGQAEGVGGMIDVSPPRAALNPHGALLRVDAHAPHGGEVDHQGVVGYAPARAIVPATADGQEHLILASKVHAADDVGHIGAAHYHTRALVDHAVVDLAGFIVVWITGLDERPSQARLELLYGRFVVHDGSPFP
jgi:hypothetical protein